MKFLGYKLYNESTTQYFLPDRRQMKFSTKLDISKIESKLDEIFDTKKPKGKSPKKIKKVTE